MKIRFAWIFPEKLGETIVGLNKHRFSYRFSDDFHAFSLVFICFLHDFSVSPAAQLATACITQQPGVHKATNSIQVSSVQTPGS